MRTPRERLAFIRFPWKIYADEPNWLPPLIHERKQFFDPARNPYYQNVDVELFGAFQSGHMVGTVAATVNPAHNRFHGDRVGFFGFFECMDDPAVATALFDAAAHWLLRRNMEVMRGPMNFSTNGECGLLIHGGDAPPVMFLPYHPAYYPSLVTYCGFSKAMDLYSYVSPDHGPPEELQQLAARVAQDHNIRIRTVDLHGFDSEVRHIHGIYNRAWSRNWGFVPITEAEVLHLSQALRSYLDPHVSLVAEVNGKPAGFVINLPDYSLPLNHMNGRLLPLGWLKYYWYKRKIDVLLVFFGGVLPEYHHMQIGALIYLEGWKRALSRGYKTLKTSWVLETNTAMNRGLQWLGAQIYRSYRIYDKPLA
jgi:hypothetical protein